MMASQSTEPTSTTIFACLFDAARHYRPTSSANFEQAVGSIPELRERTKLKQYRPPSGVGLHEHFNPKSTLVGRHVMRALLAAVEERQQQQQQREGDVLKKNNSSNEPTSSSKTCDDDADDGDVSSLCPLSSPAAQQPRCTCCGRHIVQLLRTFEGRPCVSSPFCSCSFHNHDDKQQHQHQYRRRHHHHTFIEQYPSINLSHNNGVVFAGVLPSMLVAPPAETITTTTSAHNTSNDDDAVVLGIDVMCIDMVPTAIHDGLSKNFSCDEIEEFLSLMKDYMTPLEWQWIEQSLSGGGAADIDDNHNRSEEEENEKRRKRQQMIAHEFCLKFQERRKFCRLEQHQRATHIKNDAEEIEEIKKMVADPRFVKNLFRLWRFLVLWTIKEAVLKAAGIGLGFDTTSISVSFNDAAADVYDDDVFYSIVLPTKNSDEGEKSSSTTTSPETGNNVPPLSSVKITVTVPAMTEPGGVVGPECFDTWLVLDKASMSIGAVVCAPAWTSKWSGHANYVFKKQTATTSRHDDDDDDDDAFETKTQKWIEEMRSRRKQSAGKKQTSLFRLRLLTLDHQRVASAAASTVEKNNITENSKLPLLHARVLFGGAQQQQEENSAVGVCCGCCLSRLLK